MNTSKTMHLFGTLILFLSFSYSLAETGSIPAVEKWEPEKGYLEIGAPLIEIPSEKTDLYHPVTSLFSKELVKTLKTGRSENKDMQLRFSLSRLFLRRMYSNSLLK